MTRVNLLGKKSSFHYSFFQQTIKIKSKNKILRLLNTLFDQIDSDRKWQIT